MLRAEMRAQIGSQPLEIDLSASPGDRLALAGASGAGKTTVLRLIAGLIRPDAGHISCAGTEWFHSGRRVHLPPEQRRCGVVFQDYALFPRMTALGNVTFALSERPRGERTHRAMELLGRLGLESRSKARPMALSGGCLLYTSPSPRD